MPLLQWIRTDVNSVLRSTETCFLVPVDFRFFPLAINVSTMPILGSDWYKDGRNNHTEVNLIHVKVNLEVWFFFWSCHFVWSKGTDSNHPGFWTVLYPLQFRHSVSSKGAWVIQVLLPSLARLQSRKTFKRRGSLGHLCAHFTPPPSLYIWLWCEQLCSNTYCCVVVPCPRPRDDRIKLPGARSSENFDPSQLFLCGSWWSQLFGIVMKK